MKIYLILFLVLLSKYTNYAQNNNYKVVYEFKIKKEKILNNLKQNSNSQNLNLLEKSTLIFTRSQPTEAVLLFNNEFSFYDVVEKLDINDKYSKIDPSYRFAGGNLKYYKSNSEKEIILHQNESNFDKIKEYLTKNKCHNYTIKNKSEIINGYSCMLAITYDKAGNEIKIWFTPEINTNFGPVKFCGLPGLIISIDAYAYTVNLKKIKETNQPIDRYPENIKFIDSLTLEKLNNQHFNKVFNN
jgi:GLPGLI family protein